MVNFKNSKRKYSDFKHHRISLARFSQLFRKKMLKQLTEFRVSNDDLLILNDGV